MCEVVGAGAGSADIGSDTQSSAGINNAPVTSSLAIPTTSDQLGALFADTLKDGLKASIYF